MSTFTVQVNCNPVKRHRGGGGVLVGGDLKRYTVSSENHSELY